MGIHDAMVFTLVPPAISALGNATGFDFRLQDAARPEPRRWPRPPAS